MGNEPSKNQLSFDVDPDKGADSGTLFKRTVGHWQRFASKVILVKEYYYRFQMALRNNV